MAFYEFGKCLIFNRQDRLPWTPLASYPIENSIGHDSPHQWLTKPEERIQVETIPQSVTLLKTGRSRLHMNHSNPKQNTS